MVANRLISILNQGQEAVEQSPNGILTAGRGLLGGFWGERRIPQYSPMALAAGYHL
jgi:hypothetical protein